MLYTLYRFTIERCAYVCTVVLLRETEKMINVTYYRRVRLFLPSHLLVSRSPDRTMSLSPRLTPHLSQPSHVHAPRHLLRTQRELSPGPHVSRRLSTPLPLLLHPKKFTQRVCTQGVRVLAEASTQNKTHWEYMPRRASGVCGSIPCSVECSV